MKNKSFMKVSASVLMCLGLLGATACSAEGANSTSSENIGGQVITPITMEAADLQGKTVQLMVGQVLNVTTGDLAPETVSGESSDPQVAEVQAGRADGSAVFNPGVTGLSNGTATITMKSEADPETVVEFTVTVIAATAE